MLKLFRQAKLGKIKVTFLLIFVTLQVIGTLYLPRLTADIINYGVVLQDRDYVLRTGAWMLGVAVATGLVSIPNRYMHSSAEMVNREDADNAARLIARFVRDLKGSETFIP